MSPPARLRILLVDDDPGLRTALARYLTRSGCDVVTAAHGGEGLEQLAHADFDAVVSDIDMPEMDGFTFRGRVLEQHPDLAHRFLLCSGSALHLRRVDPSIPFLQKPFEAGELLAAVERLYATWPGETHTDIDGAARPPVITGLRPEP